MKQIDFNESKLTDIEIDKVVRKVRAIVINNKTKQMLVVHYAGLYMLPGGSIDNGETEVEALRRELLEEAGIEVEAQQTVPYLLINSYDRNYFDRKSGNINRLTQTTFFVVSTEQDIDETKKMRHNFAIMPHSILLITIFISLPQNQYIISLSNLRKRVANIMQTRK